MLSAPFQASQIHEHYLYRDTNMLAIVGPHVLFQTFGPHEPLCSIHSFRPICKKRCVCVCVGVARVANLSPLANFRSHFGSGSYFSSFGSNHFGSFWLKPRARFRLKPRARFRLPGGLQGPTSRAPRSRSTRPTHTHTHPMIPDARR